MATANPFAAESTIGPAKAKLPQQDGGHATSGLGKLKDYAEADGEDGTNSR